MKCCEYDPCFSVMDIDRKLEGGIYLLQGSLLKATVKMEAEDGFSVDATASIDGGYKTSKELGSHYMAKTGVKITKTDNGEVAKKNFFWKLFILSFQVHYNLKAYKNE